MRTAFIEPGSPWENGCLQSANSKLRDEPLDGGTSYSPKQAQILIQGWLRQYTTSWPNSALGWLAAAHEVRITPAAVRPQPGPSIAMATHSSAS